MHLAVCAQIPWEDEFDHETARGIANVAGSVGGACSALAPSSSSEGGWSAHSIAWMPGGQKGDTSSTLGGELLPFLHEGLCARRERWRALAQLVDSFAYLGTAQ